MKQMNYNKGTGKCLNWIISEEHFLPKFQGKCETIFCLGNGYMGLRSATEESYVGQVRNCFIAGTFNKSADNEVTELPNAADMIGLDIIIDGDRFSLERGTFSNYDRSLNLKTGELIRTFNWKNSDGKEFQFTFKRFVSLAERHTLVCHFQIKPINCQADIIVKSGINGQVSNSGAQHFEEGEKRVFDKEYIQMTQLTNQSRISFIHTSHHKISNNYSELNPRFELDRRKILTVFEAKLDDGQAFELTKVSNLFTSQDNDISSVNANDIQKFALEQLKIQSKKGYNQLLEENILAWEERWNFMDIKIESDNDFNQLAIRFAQYHLFIMTPKHDNRFGIGAKGLSGEGYKGHSFWDTEIFILPFFTYTFPEIAKSLLIYRHYILKSARMKAKENGYAGAMYPWESALSEDGEVTPVWGAIDIITGKATKIWSGFIEQHITADVAFAVWQYYMITDDHSFMEDYGYEIILDTGIFWASRLDWDKNSNSYHIKDIIGPDEYKEHINNDAFTNYMAKWCMENCLYYAEYLKKEQPEIYQRINEKIEIENYLATIKEKSGKLFLPAPRDEDLVIPQDDTYLNKPTINLSQYKSQKHVGSIFRDFNLDQINGMQVSKQASVVMLMYLLEHKFSHDIKEANFKYYEPKTLHDSSLSLSTHAIIAADINHLDLSYSLFQRAANIDLGPNMSTSDHGIHAASLGGIWQIIVNGYAGIRMVGGKLRISPNMPPEIKTLSFSINWKSSVLKIELDHQKIILSNLGEDNVQLDLMGTDVSLQKEIVHEYHYALSKTTIVEQNS